MDLTSNDISARSNANRSIRALWIALLVTCSIVLSPLYACVTPLAALAAVSALKLERRDTVLVLGSIWLTNQVIGYGYLGYPWTWDSAAWGLAIGVATGLAALAASGLSAASPVPLAVSLPFVAAFAAFELALYAAGFVLPNSSAAFTASVVGPMFLINALTLCGLMVAHQVLLLFGATVTALAPSNVSG